MMLPVNMLASVFGDLLGFFVAQSGLQMAQRLVAEFGFGVSNTPNLPPPMQGVCSTFRHKIHLAGSVK